MGSHLISDPEHIETELSVNYPKKKRKTTQVQALPHKKVFYSGGVCNLLFSTFLVLRKKSTWLTETLTFTPCPQHLQKP